MRGNQRGVAACTRSIEVYPRVCGGTAAVQPSHAGVRGLSPRVRGNRLHHPDRPLIEGSIPACAGEPATTLVRCRRLMVYPRVCGGTRDHTSQMSAVDGLSPRVRGNHTHLVRYEQMSGSIPACAGEPSGGCRRLTRVRGNPIIPAVSDLEVRSIPACAGEPMSRYAANTSNRRGSIPACAGEPYYPGCL